MKAFCLLIIKCSFQASLHLIAAIFFLISVNSPAKADSTITSGTTLYVSAGTTLVNAGTLTIKSGGAISNLGTVNVAGNLDNQNVANTDLGAGTFLLNGTSLQNVNGQNTFGNLTINNIAGISLNGNTTVNNTLGLTSGRVTIGSNNLLLGASASVSGSPSATAMVVATGTGEFRKSFTSAGSFTYPVGDNTGTAEFSPVTLAFTGGAFGAGNYAGVNLVNSQYPGSPLTGSYLNRYWNITQSGISSFACNATMQYLLADVAGTESQIYCLQINPSSVVYFNAANTVLHQLSANSLSTFGTFTGSQVLANKNLTLTLLLEGLYNGSGTMRKAQNSTGDQFPGTTADQITIELHNSSSYPTIVYSLSNINLSTAGASTMVIPGIHSGSYYVTIKHRNSVETTTVAPVSFAGSTINYNFVSAASQAFGNNLKAFSGGYFTIYGGDATQDGSVDGADMALVDNASTNILHGYIYQDVNGDGIVDGADMALLDNNSTAVVQKHTP
jgi:hypothetical protein